MHITNKVRIKHFVFIFRSNHDGEYRHIRRRLVIDRETVPFDDSGKSLISFIHSSDFVLSGQAERIERAGNLLLQEQDAASADVDAPS